MIIRSLQGRFGRLDGESLTAQPGLNIIEAPNESGKSTWTALLRVMLYGLSTKDRSPDADKRKYMPWSGAPMEGSLSVHTNDGNVTILRRTQRPGSPMGQFSAVYTGTAEPVSWLSAANCGEALTGVPQEVYQRSAFIRQSGISVDQCPALEQRIAALLTSGQEDTSYSEAAQRLKQQMNHRRVNRSTGLIPQLDREIDSARSTLSEVDQLGREIRETQAALDDAEARETSLGTMLSHRTAANTLRDARDAWQAAQQEASRLTDRLAGLPDRERLLALLRDLDGLDAAEETLAQADAQAEEAARQLAASEDAASPRRSGPLPLLLAVAAGLLLFGLLLWRGQSLLVALGAGLGAFGLLSILLFSPLLHPKRTGGQEAYAQAAAAWKAASALQEGCRKTCRAKEAAILEGVRSFCDTADRGSVRSAIEGALGLLDSLEAARRREAETRSALEAAEAAAPPSQGPSLSPEDWDAAEARLAETGEEVLSLRRRLHTAQGRKSALDAGETLPDRLRNLEDRRDRLEEEYDALALASQVLEEADLQIQRKFSPALGEISSKIFAKLTDTKYNKVLLDTALQPSAQETGHLAPHDRLFLSQGAADQLYLAVRLAISETVLPREDPPPLVLDDALVTFDDRRCSAALEYLVELSRTRQILLFTCQSRERHYLEQAHPGAFHCVRF